MVFSHPQKFQNFKVVRYFQSPPYHQTWKRWATFFLQKNLDGFRIWL